MYIKSKGFACRKGQSTVEYIVLVTAILGILILFLNGPTSPFRTKLVETLNTSTNGLEAIGNTLSTSHTSPAGKASGDPTYITNSEFGGGCANGLDLTTGECKP